MITHSHDVIVSNVSGVWLTSRTARYRRTGRFRSVKVGQKIMPHNVTHEAIEKTLAALCGRYTMNVSDTVRIIGARLPGNAVCVILRPIGDGVMRVVYDEDKPHALAHTRTMLQEWWESYAEPVAFPDGSVELVQRPSPPLPSGPVPLSMTG